jgi:hypothetical protein
MLAHQENNMVEVEILGQVITHQYGTLNSGDVLRTSAEFAKHLVEDCSAARYRDTPQAAAEPDAVAALAPEDGGQVAEGKADAVSQPPAPPAVTRARASKKQ